MNTGAVSHADGQSTQMHQLDKHLTNPKPALDKSSNKPVPSDKESNSLVAELRARIAELEQQVADLQQPFDKTVYQREYMRKRRSVSQ